MINKNIFTVDDFLFSDDYFFPGKYETEELIYVTREDKKILVFKRGLLILTSLLIVLIGNLIPFENIKTMLTGIAALEMFIGWFFLSFLWKKNIVIVTNQRIVQFVYKNFILKNTNILFPSEIFGFEIVDSTYLSKFFKLKTLIIKKKKKHDKNIVVGNISNALELKDFLIKGLK